MARVEGKWTEVLRRSKRIVIDGETQRKNADARRKMMERKYDATSKKTLTSFIDKKATSFYFAGVSDDISEAEMWRAFTKVGKVVDVYLARKKNKAGLNFGFVRFIGIEDPLHFEKKLCGIRIGKGRLTANLARYERQQRIPAVIAPRDSRELFYANRSYQRVSKGRSFADAVKGHNANSSNHGNETIKLSTDEVMFDWLQSNLVGKVSSFNTLWNIRNILDAEGCDNIVVRYLGGLYVLMKFDNHEKAEEFLIIAKDTWSKWFDSLTHWSSNFCVKERFVSLIISGLPPNAWSTVAFSEVAKKWGTVIAPEDCCRKS